jgi:ABC-type multidrug transport system ATPase subunit
MTVISLTLPGNVLHTEEQKLEFEKIATFIGGNGSGKSSILKSIFDEKLKPASMLYDDYKIVCFSSGQNESYSSNFSDYLNTERSKRNALNLDCFYYDKVWSKLLIFLATSGKKNGLVRTFLKQNNYVVESEFDEDETTKLYFNVKVEQSYTNLVRQSLEDEENDANVITNKPYHRTLHNFIHSLINDNYDFEDALEQVSIELNQDILSRVSFEADGHAPFDSKVMFFTQASDNDFFIVKDTFELTFEKIDAKGNKTLRLEELSDGEYQLLFLYALVDLFDTESTLFLFDEADSHLHYKNIEKLWNIYSETQGLIITTTHLLDSIAKAGIDKLRIIEHGKVQDTNSSFKLLQRLESLSEVEETQYKIVSMYKNIVVMDHAHDWEIFKLLLKRKLSNNEGSDVEIDKKLSDYICLGVSSGYVKGQDKNTFGDNKINWLKNYEYFLKTLKTLNKLTPKTKRVFLICDGDDYPYGEIGTIKCPFYVKGHEFKETEPAKKPKKANKKNLIEKIQKPKDQKPLSQTALLSWKRREIKHYLLSYTVLGNECDEINRHHAEDNHLKVGKNADLGIDQKPNESIAKHPSDPVKKIVDPYINVDGHGFCCEKAQNYVNGIPPEEISEDIVNMYNYLVGENA